MIVAIEGIITKKEPTNCVIKLSNGISYSVNISLNCSAKLEKNAKIELLITQIIREDANLLFGFLEADEQKMFEMLIKLSGIGASTAMAVCSSLSSESFSKAVINGDTATLTSVPGIGPKTARRIVAELGDAKLMEFSSGESYKNEAAMALESLGFKRDKINKVLSECSSTSTAELVKEALKKLA
ncbi:MAG: Holliday junction branch migration protein RuvA [Campylobacter sp.]|nr:Holliday junction branch migration protein RuvA [Campylobacter sp.]